MTVRSIATIAAAFVMGGLVLAGGERLMFAAAAAPGCNATVTRTWSPVTGRAYRTEAYANGSNCAQAVVTIAVRGADGVAMWSDAAPAQRVMTFSSVKTRAQMVQALGEWLAQDNMFKTTADLPPWLEGEDAPQSGEFPFYPEPGFDRETYEQVRAQKLSVFCYVQGMESLACLVVMRDGQMDKIGVQSFPG